MSRKTQIIIAVALVLIAPVAWYLVSPLWRVVERNDPSPLAASSASSTGSQLPVKASNADEQKKLDGMMAGMGKREIKSAEGVPFGAHLSANGSFISAAHDVSGQAMLISTKTGKILRFEDFQTLNGPDLRVYLSVDAKASSFVDIGSLKATKGHVNHDIPKDTDTSRYPYVLIWCKPFGVLFGYARLEPAGSTPL